MKELSNPLKESSPLVLGTQEQINAEFVSFFSKATPTYKFRDYVLYKLGTLAHSNIRFAMKDPNTSDVIFILWLEIKNIMGIKMAEEKLLWKKAGYLPASIISLFIEYIIPCVKYLLCSNEHTDSGIRFWQNLVKQSELSKYYVYEVVFSNTRLSLLKSHETPYDMLPSFYWGPDKEHIRLLLTTKEIKWTK